MEAGELVSRGPAISAALTLRGGHANPDPRKGKAHMSTTANSNSAEAHFVGASLCCISMRLHRRWEAVVKRCGKWLSITSASQPAGSTQQLIFKFYAESSPIVQQWTHPDF